MAAARTILHGDEHPVLHRRIWLAYWETGEPRFDARARVTAVRLKVFSGLRELAVADPNLGDGNLAATARRDAWRAIGARSLPRVWSANKRGSTASKDADHQEAHRLYAQLVFTAAQALMAMGVQVQLAAAGGTVPVEPSNHEAQSRRLLAAAVALLEQEAEYWRAGPSGTARNATLAEAWDHAVAMLQADFRRLLDENGIDDQPEEDER
jgi:hypothetical protein